MSLLEIIEASFAYEKTGNNVFQEMSTSIEPGEICCFMGPNGCGKTTLLDCILGVHKLRKGRILFNGKDISSFRPGEIARHIAYVPQSHERTFPYRVIDIVKMGRAAYTGRFSSPSAQDKAIAQQALELVGLSHLKHRPYTQLSGGEGQLVMIARALAQKTPVIVMDEPTAHLDFKHEMVVLETIVRLVKNSGITVIMATHFPNHAFYFENNELNIRVALMHNKKILALGSPSDVIREENMKLIYNVNTKMVSCPLDNESELRQLIPVGTII